MWLWGEVLQMKTGPWDAETVPEVERCRERHHLQTWMLDHSWSFLHLVPSSWMPLASSEKRWTRVRREGEDDGQGVGWQHKEARAACCCRSLREPPAWQFWVHLGCS